MKHPNSNSQHPEKLQAPITQRHLEIMQHSLGLNPFAEGTMYRNRFVTGPEGDDFKLCRELVRGGLMQDHGPIRTYGGMHYFLVTDKGKRLVLEQSPKRAKVSRSRRRYLEFLEADSGLLFIEWLKRKRYTA